MILLQFDFAPDPEFDRTVEMAVIILAALITAGLMLNELVKNERLPKSFSYYLKLFILSLMKTAVVLTGCGMVLLILGLFFIAIIFSC